MINNQVLSTTAAHARKVLGISANSASSAEKAISAAGGGLSILVLYLCAQWINPSGDFLLLASMGASAVLLFAVPHGQLSQPWPVAGGHILSALVGVSCALLFPYPVLSAALAVGIAIGLMYLLRCIHPPGGATALFAAISGMEEAGYGFVLNPVTFNVAVLLLTAISFNAFFPWRRYPAALSRKARSKRPTPIKHESFVYALSQLDTFIDVTEQDLLRIYDLAIERESASSMIPSDILPGRFYSNGRYGEDWWVRQVVDEHTDPHRDQDDVIFKTVAGKGRRQSGCISRAEFARAVEYEVYRDEDNWKKLETESAHPDN